MASRLILCLLTWSIVTAVAHAEKPSIEDLAALQPPQIAATLARLRDSLDGAQTLLELEIAAGIRAEARRDGGAPPLSAGCFREDEFELGSQLTLARQAASGADYRAAAREYTAMTGALLLALDQARSSGNWKRRFPHLKRWIREWTRAKEPRTRELMRRTLTGQAIRASLSAFEGARIYGTAKSPLAVRAYDEYVFNLMCNEDEANLRWFKAQIAAIGWFDIRRFGPAADHAALLLVQHSDADPVFQAQMVQVLEPRLARGDTNAENLAYLVDRVAVRAGMPQKFGTQMECVDGDWVVPQIEDPARLDERRTRMDLVPYSVQLERTRNICRKNRPEPGRA